MGEEVARVRAASAERPPAAATAATGAEEEREDHTNSGSVGGNGTDIRNQSSNTHAKLKRFDW
jgi:hypothetical protein